MVISEKELAIRGGIASVGSVGSTVAGLYALDLAGPACALLILHLLSPLAHLLMPAWQYFRGMPAPSESIWAPSLFAIVMPGANFGFAAMSLMTRIDDWDLRTALVTDQAILFASFWAAGVVLAWHVSGSWAFRECRKYRAARRLVPKGQFSLAFQV